MTVRDAEVSLLKKMNKGKQGQATYDPKKPRVVRIHVAPSFPPPAPAPSGRTSACRSSRTVRELLTQRGLIEDKRAMPFVQAFKLKKFGTHTAFNRNRAILRGQVLAVEEAKSKTCPSSRKL
ncbi:hypothetical protein OH76DRAFT_1553412 [Lentinus brumalis]|uniref:Uncharacterized protein n=1 Tax=Lentinus brumalis TaxID=2498619 RepID=A0A371DL81_9APHY|nr:hypothetical protein OH76DRAFT_1553412 [Polyporus brumalis]